MQIKNVLIIICAVIVVGCIVIATTVFVTRYNTTPNTSVPTAPVAPAPVPATAPVPAPVANTTVAVAPAQPAADDNMLAQIINVKPHMISIRIPYTRCRDESRVVSVQQQESVPGAGMVIGGVAGGVLGNQVGQGRGRDVATVVGAIGGAIAGSAVQQNMNRPVDQTVVEHRCFNRSKTVRKQKGYEVTYLYKGVQGVRVLQTQPIGTQMPIAVLQAAPALEDIAQ